MGPRWQSGRLARLREMGDLEGRRWRVARRVGRGRGQGDRAMEEGADQGPDCDPAWVEAVRARLADWYATARRLLPWRNDRDPYHILVSETMLVQTTVAAVVPYYSRFLERFPTIETLAAADEADVIKAWEGLGYYRRARQLHAAAKAVVSDFGGAIPDDPDAVRALPGVGRYIAGAVLSFAFDRPAPIVEANTQRVLARWLAWRGDLKAASTQARLWEAAARLVPPHGAGAFNQAFMELGALVCTPRAPMCLVCPVSAECRARALGLQDTLPITSPKPPPLASSEAAALVVRDGRVLIVERSKGGLWAGFWEFPTVHVSGADPAGRRFDDGSTDLAEGVRRLSGVDAEVGPVVQTVQYGVTRHRVRLDAHRARGLTEELTPGAGMMSAVWERPESLPNYPFSAAGRRLMKWVLRPGDETGEFPGSEEESEK
jgi:A/G-specific adenine glycosylase